MGLHVLVRLFSCMHVHSVHAYCLQRLKESKIPWYWSDRWLWATLWVLGIYPGSSAIADASVPTSPLAVLSAHSLVTLWLMANLCFLIPSPHPILRTSGSISKSFCPILDLQCTLFPHVSEELLWPFDFQGPREAGEWCSPLPHHLDHFNHLCFWYLLSCYGGSIESSW